MSDEIDKLRRKRLDILEKTTQIVNNPNLSRASKEVQIEILSERNRAVKQKLKRLEKER